MWIYYGYFHFLLLLCSVVQSVTARILAIRAVSTLRGQITKLTAFLRPPKQNEKTFASGWEYTGSSFRYVFISLLWTAARIRPIRVAAI
jgi:hypothetical protein